MRERHTEKEREREREREREKRGGIERKGRIIRIRGLERDDEEETLEDDTIQYNTIQ